MTNGDYEESSRNLCLVFNCHILLISLKNAIRTENSAALELPSSVPNIILGGLGFGIEPTNSFRGINSDLDREYAEENIRKTQKGKGRNDGMGNGKLSWLTTCNTA